MAKRKRSAARSAAARAASAAATTPAANEEQIAYSGLSLHDLFQQQAMRMLDRTDLDEEQKQSVLIAMSCPCCGGTGLSFTAKLER